MVTAGLVLGPARLWDMATTLSRAALDAEVTKQAPVVSHTNDFKLMMIVALVALLLIFLLKRAKAQSGAAIVDNALPATCAYHSLVILLKVVFTLPYRD